MSLGAAIATAAVVVAVAAAMARGGSSPAARAAASSPWLAGLQHHVPELTFADCQRESFPALDAEGLTAKYKGPSRSWYGRGSTGFSATIFCYEGADGNVWVTIVAAHHRSFDAAAKTAQDLLKRLRGTGGTKVTSGVYNADTVFSGAHYRGTVTLSVSGNKVTGSSHWSCCPGERSDPHSGTVEGSHFSFIRDCAGQGQGGACAQTWTGSAVGPGRLEGKIEGHGSSANGTFVLVKVG